MPIPVVCPGCSAKLNAPDAAAGKKLKCPKCGDAITLPAAAPAPQFEVVEDEPASPAKKPAFVSGAHSASMKSRPKAVAEEDDEDDEKPRKKKRDEDGEDDEKLRKKKKKKTRSEDDEEKRGVSMARNIIGAVVLLILVGVAGAVYYFKFFDKDNNTASKTNSGDPPAGPPAGPQGPGPKEPSIPGPEPKLPGPGPKLPGQNPKRPKRGSSADKYDRLKATKAALLHGEWLVVWEGSISAMKQMRDAKTVTRECQTIEKYATEIQRITKDLKAIGRIRADAWGKGTLDVNGWNRLKAEYPATVKATEKRIEALGMPELIDSLRNALASVDKANETFVETFNAVGPDQPVDKEKE